MAIQKASELAKVIEEIVSDAYCGDEDMPFQRALTVSAGLIRADRKVVIEEVRELFTEWQHGDANFNFYGSLDSLLRELD
jgi:hypothetical protein